MGIQLRDFQKIDVDAVLELRAAGVRRVLGRAATGLGKATELAFLARHFAGEGRVMILVDTVKLVRQLAETVRLVTGINPGVEMGEERADNGGGFVAADRIILATPQTLISGEKGKERYRRFNPADFSAVLLDECESFFRTDTPFREPVEWFYQGNPDLFLYGCTATPFRTDGVSAANLFDAVAFDRDILWGIGEGWLVKARQAFVRVSVDFSTLTIRKNAEGEEDFSDAEIADRIQNEQTLIELAKGIIHVAGDRRTIVVCPKVASARAVADYLNAERDGCARCVYGALGDEEKDDVMEAHRRGEFQFLTSVMMLTKGYDDPEVSCVCNCRKTKSKRLYQQVLGRGTRPLRGVVDGLAGPTERRAAIDASRKPDMLMVNMVGVNEHVRDVTLVDILGVPNMPNPDDADAAVLERAKELQIEEGMEVDAALEQAVEDVEAEREAAKCLAESEAEELAKDEEEDMHRKRVTIEARVDVEYQDDLEARGEGTRTETGISEAMLSQFRSFGLDDGEIAKLRRSSPEVVDRLRRELFMRRKKKLCSWRQSKVLQRAGYTKGELHTMSYDQASAAIEAAKANGWKRPMSEEVAA